MLVVNRFAVAGDDQETFGTRARAALAALAGRPGYLRGSLGRAYDDPSHWCLCTEWESVGAYRRALSAYEVKVTATPLLAESLDEPSAYEELALADPGGEVRVRSSDRAPAELAGAHSVRAADPRGRSGHARAVDPFDPPVADHSARSLRSLDSGPAAAGGA